MPEVILPCPDCGSTWVMANTSPSGADIVQCCNCYMHGPLCDSEEYAIERWNALPRMSAVIAWQFQAAGAALALQRVMDAAKHMREAQQAYEQYGSNEDSVAAAEDVFDGLIADARRAFWGKAK